VAAEPKGAPKELKLGFVDFFSGAAAIFGVTGKNAAEWLVDTWNKGSVLDLLNLIEDCATFIPMTALIPRAQDRKASFLGLPTVAFVPSLAGK
jgi:hypothetical protein